MNTKVIPLIALLCASCQTPPVVTPQVNVAAVRQQNAQTQQHISKTSQHIKKSQDTERQVNDHLAAVNQDLDTLLAQPVAATKSQTVVAPSITYIVGQTYVNVKTGKKSVYQADGSWRVQP